MTAQTSQGLYSGPLVIDPLTRIEGHLRIEVDVEQGRVREARSVGTLFRGLEPIVCGRDPRDVALFTQRTCGVCTYVHALASTRALEDAAKVQIPPAARLIRDLVLGMQYLHDHIVHFYHLHGLDFVDVSSALKADPGKAAKLLAEVSPWPSGAAELKGVQTRLKTFVDGGQLGIFANSYAWGGHPAYRLSPEGNLIITAHYLKALRIQASAARAMAVFGGKNPHPQFLVPGGVTCYESLQPARLDEFALLHHEVSEFVHHAYMPDLLLLARAYKDWSEIGGTDAFMTFGEFCLDPGKPEHWLNGGVLHDRNLATLAPVDTTKIEEHIRHSWYVGEAPRQPYEGETVPHFTFMGDTDRYTWMKAPRYAGRPYETGPLAQLLVSYARGDQGVVAAMDQTLQSLGLPLSSLYSTLGRTTARAIETRLVAERIPQWLDMLRGMAGSQTKLVEPCPTPKAGRGTGFVTAPRGGLSHWMVIDKEVVKNFQLVVPSTWNFGPRCAAGLAGPVEQALVGTPIADPTRPVEILRTVHSFDPCIACAVHLIDSRTNKVGVFRVS